MEEKSTNPLQIYSQINEALDARLTYLDLLVTVLTQHEKTLDDLIRKLRTSYDSYTTIRDVKNIEQHLLPLTCIVQA